MSSVHKVSRLVTRLIQLTGQGKVRWVRLPPAECSLAGNERVNGFVYRVSIDGDHFQVYEYEHQDLWEGEILMWVPDLALELIDADGRVIWRAPKNVGIAHLYQAVSEQAADLDRLMAKLDRLAAA